MNNKKPIYIFLLLLPFIDLITSLSTRFFPLPLSLGAIIKILFLFIMTLYIIFKSTSKYRKKSIIFICLIILYSIFYMITKIQYLTFTQLINEFMYLFKIMFYPLLLPSLLCYFDDKKISIKELEKVFYINIITYVLLLFIPLITNTGFDTYGHLSVGTTGWFYSPNEIATITTLLFPFLFTKIEKKLPSYILILFTIIILSTIGTKVSMLGLVIDMILVLIILLFKHKKKLALRTLILLLCSIVIFTQSATITNYKNSVALQEKEGQKEDNKKDKESEEVKTTTTTKKAKEEKKEVIVVESTEERLLREEYLRIKEEEYNKSKNDSKIEKFINKYFVSLLSDRDIYFKVSYKIYEEQYSIKTLLFGIGYSNTTQINNFAITKLIEMDPLDIFLHNGLIALIIIFIPAIYYIYYFIKKRIFNEYTIFYTLMLGLILAISCISGHTLMAPAVSIYLVLYFILGFAKINLIEEKNTKINNNKVTIYGLHLNYGGVEKNICTKANILSKIYDVEIISLYKLTDNPVFKLNKNIKVTYLTNNIKPNREEFKESIKSKNIIKIIKNGIYAIKVLYLKDVLLTKSMINCNSEIIISTRIDFTEKLIKNNEYNSIKIAEEHIYHNNNSKYLNRLYKVLNRIDYLMPSSDYLTNNYKSLFKEYNNKIITNKMPIDTDNAISDLSNNTIISVGRLDNIKRFNELIDIFESINNNKWKLKIVGNGAEYDNLQALINKSKLNNNIELLGFKTNEELNKLYSTSSIYVMTSIEESFGLVLLEAASHGLPILAYDSALGAKEILKNNSKSLIKDRNKNDMIDSLTKLMNDKKIRKQYQNDSISISKYYDYKIIEEYNIEFYKNIEKNNIFKNLYLGSKKECYNLIENKLKNKEKTFIVTANPETYMLSKSNKDIDNIINNKNNLIVPDGISIVKTAQYLEYNIKERITGVDIAEYLLKLANKNKYKIYLFGAKEEVIKKLKDNIVIEYPNIKIVDTSNGYASNKDQIMEKIKSLKPDIVMVALGIPNQEILINKHIKDFDKGIFIGVGGSFDVLSGSKKRAPKIFIKTNTEWLYRIISEPKRITRFLKYNIRFIKTIRRYK